MHRFISHARSLCAVALAALALQACAPGVARVEPTAASVAIVTIPTPSRYSMFIDKHPDATGSQARSMFFGADLLTGSNKLADTMDAAPAVGDQFRASLSTDLLDTLVDAMRRLRTDSSILIAREPHKDRIEFVSNYVALQKDANTFVEVIPREYGYWSVWPERIYHPWVRLEYRVYDAQERKVVKTGFIGTGVAPGDGAWSAVPQDETFAFASFEALLADPARAAAGLRATTRQVAEALALKL